MNQSIPGHAFDEATPIKKGLSGDEKYRVKTLNGDLMFLRISNISEYERKKTMYYLMERDVAPAWYLQGYS